MNAPARTRQAVQLAGYQGPASVLTQAMQRLVAALQAGEPATDWAFEPDVTASGETARSLFDSVQRGQRQLCYVASSYLSAQVPALELLDIPFSVFDRTAALHALGGEIGTALADAVRAATGLRVLGYWDNGVRHLSNGVRQIRHPRDCAGLTLRTLDSSSYRAAFTALGFNPVSIDVRALHHAVATGLVQAQENPLTNLLLFDLWRHHRFVSLTEHLFGVALLVVNEAWWQSLGTHLRWLLHAAVAGGLAAQHQQALEEDARAVPLLAAGQVAVLQPAAIDIAAMRQRCAALHAEMCARLPRDWLGMYLQR